MNVASLLYRSAQRCPQEVAWVHGERSATYGRLVGRVSRIAAGLREAGLKPGDQVLIDMPNRPELIEHLMAAMWGGFVAVPINWHLRPDEVAYIAGHSSASAMVVSRRTAAAAEAVARELPGCLLVDVDAAPETHRAVAEGPRLDDDPGPVPPPRPVAPEDPAWLFYTSGTTGRPKGATLTHRNLMAMSVGYYASVDHVEPHSVYLHAAPLTHGSGLYLLPLLGRAATNVIATGARFDPGVVFADMARHGATRLAFLAPTMLNRLVAAADAPGARAPVIESAVVGGAPLYADDLVRAIEVLGPVVTQIYGQGESPMSITVMPPGELTDGRRLSCGRALDAIAVTVRDDDGRELPPGETGEIHVRGDTVMSGYWCNPAATAEALRDGRLRTGDVGHLDDAGYLYLTDRSKDVIISGGSNIHPREVEEALLTHPEVIEAAVVGRPDREWGEAVTAYVVLRQGATVAPDELIAHAREHIAAFKRPRHLALVDALPKNAAGKVLKRDLPRLVEHQQMS